MKQTEAVILAFVLLFLNKCSHPWFFKSVEKPNESTQVNIPNDVPFEMQTADEKFLMQADFIKDLSPLEACHHLVVAEIQETCSGISEEDLGKLSVNLLNCQSQSEGRRVYPCTSEMTIADCTQDMDSTVWNAYQIVSNRARAICYNTRQHQFRMKTEMTVNKLVYSAEHQLNTMGTIKKGQDKMIDKATETLEQMKVDQTELITQQSRLKTQQVTIQSSIAITLRDLYKEKALIASGHKTFTEMTEVLTQKLDNATDILVSQQKEQRDNHREILEDLTDIQDKTKEVWQRIDEGNQQVLDFQKETTDHYRETLENLEKVNDTVNFVMNLINDTQGAIETKLNWMLALIGTSGASLDLIITVGLHLLYFIMAAFSASFLNTPTFSRLLLLALVPLNAWSEVKTGKSLGFVPMTMFILLSTAANWATGWIVYLALFKSKRQTPHTVPSLSTPVPSIKQSSDSASQPPTGESTNNGSHDNPSQKEGVKKNGLTNEQLHKLVEMLQKLHASGMLTPDRDLATPTTTYPADQHVPVNTPISAPVPSEGGTSFCFSDKVLMNSSCSKYLDSQRKDTPSVLKLTDRLKTVPAASSPRVDLVKRHLMKTLADELNCSTESDDEAFHAPPTPSDSRTSTPCGTPRSSRKRGGDPLNQSSQSKAQCLAITKAGMPCKNLSVDASAFCRRHQVT